MNKDSQNNSMNHLNQSSNSNKSLKQNNAESKIKTQVNIDKMKYNDQNGIKMNWDKNQENSVQSNFKDNDIQQVNK